MPHQRLNHPYSVAVLVRSLERMLRISREGGRWIATDGESEVIASTRIGALRSMSQRAQTNPITQPRRWVLYATSDDDLVPRFADTVLKTGRPWKPVVVDPFRLDEAIKALQPEAVVVAMRKPQDKRLLRRAFALHGDKRVVVDDSTFHTLSQLLSWTKIGHA